MIKVNPNIFRAYDIRGTADPTPEKPVPDLTPETIEIIGRAAATYLIQKYHCQSLAVGRDNRLHSEKLQKAFIAGVLSTGLNVTDIGLATSPLTYFAAGLPEFDCTVNITASHNPKEDNGIKISVKNARAIAGDSRRAIQIVAIAGKEIQEILKIIQDENFLNAANPGKLSFDNSVFNRYLEKVRSVTRLKRPLKVVIDAGNGVAGKFAPDLFKSIGAQVIEQCCELDGTFPNHEANPEKEINLQDLKRAVIKNGADLGIAFDGDGDRCGIVGNDGKFYPAEYILMLLSRYLLANHPGEKVLFDVKVSNNLIKDISEHGGLPIMSRTGHAFIKARLKEEQATLAGEKSGHFFFGQKFFNWFGFDDGLFAGCKILEALSQSDQSFSEIFQDLKPLPYLPEYKIGCEDSLKPKIMEQITASFEKKYDCITIDGVRARFPDNSWALIRYSNTSPYFTIFAEAPTADRLEEIKSLVFAELKKYPELKFPN